MTKYARHHQLRGLYVITDSALIPINQLVPRVNAAIDGGACIVQYRDKSRDQTRRLLEATALSQACRDRGATFIVNDDPSLALEAEADGVHLGGDDASPQQARELLGPDAVIGISCYNNLERAEQAVQAGADYIAFGRFFPSQSKPQAIQADISLLREAKALFGLPIAAIGGITPENGGALIAAGADMLAIIHGVFGQEDVRLAAQAYAVLFNK